MRRLAVVGAAFAVLLGSYAVADIYDLAPGILTRDGARTPQADPTAQATAPAVSLPTAAAATLPLASLKTTAPLPTQAALAGKLDPLVAQAGLGRTPGVVVRDGLTGAPLYATGADTPRLAASTQKVLAAAAVVHGLDPNATLPTTVVEDGVPGRIALVAGGDTMLARGGGIPDRIGGRAGLGDLATQVLGALRSQGTTAVTLRLDLSYAAGPAYGPKWNQADVSAGATQGVFMIGLEDQRPAINRPSPRDPPAQVAAVFAEQLRAAGIKVTLAPESTWKTKVAAGAAVLGQVQSAPIVEVLTEALDDSDNALTEGLVRQAAVAAGQPATFAGETAYIQSALTALGISTKDVDLLDASGLSRGQSVPVRAIADVLALGTTGRNAALQQVFAGLPVAGLTGTLTERFDTKTTHLAAGVARSKTGTLLGTSGMAGTTVDADGRLLLFAVIADGVPATGTGTLEARAALDRFVAGLTGCGCS